MKYLLAVSLCLSLTGCAFLASLFEKGPKGTPSMAEVAAVATSGIPIWGQIVGAVAAVGTLAFGGHKVHKHVKKKRAERAKDPLAGISIK